MARPTFIHFGNWALTILAPYVFLVVGFIFIKTHRKQHRFEKVFDLGYDSCILGIGIAATLLSGSEYQAVLGTNAAWAPMLFGLFIMALLYGLDRSGYGRLMQARWSVLVGATIFGANTAMVTWLNERNIFSTALWGIASFVVPFAVCYLIITKLNYPDAIAAHDPGK